MEFPPLSRLKKMLVKENDIHLGYYGNNYKLIFDTKYL